MRRRLALLVPALLLLAPLVLGPTAAAEDEAWQETSSGLRYQVIREGRPGTEPEAGDRVEVHYTGTFASGEVFDSSREKGQPFSFVLGQGAVIRGWDEGVALMTEGSRYRFHVPWALAYGERGRGPIPPRTDLYFDVELLDVARPPRFRPGDPEAQQRLPSGLVYEVLEAGEGTPPQPDQGIKARFAFWNTAGDLIYSTATSGQHLAGVVQGLKLGRAELDFLDDILVRMKPGARVRCEVPAELAFGQQQVHPKLPAGATTVWEIELLAVNDVPPFRTLDAAATRTTPSGLAYQVIRPGEGPHPAPTDTVEVYYTGWLEDGTIFDSGHARGETTSFPLNRVIAGWTEGVQLMRPGAIYLFRIPGPLAYGPRPPPGSSIPPNATLIFLIELVGAE